LKEEIRTYPRLTRPHGGPLITSDSAVRSIQKKDDFLFGLKGYQQESVYEGFYIYVLYFKNIVIKIDIQQSYDYRNGGSPKEDKITTFKLDSPLLFLNMNDVINIVLEDSIADGNKIDWNKDWLSDTKFSLKSENADIFVQLNSGLHLTECKIVKTIRKQIVKLIEKNDLKKMQYQLGQQQSLISSMQDDLHSLKFRIKEQNEFNNLIVQGVQSIDEKIESLRFEREEQNNLIQSSISSMQNQFENHSELISSLLNQKSVAEQKHIFESDSEDYSEDDELQEQSKLISSFLEKNEESNKKHIFESDSEDNEQDKNNIRNTVGFGEEKSGSEQNDSDDEFGLKHIDILEPKLPFKLRSPNPRQLKRQLETESKNRLKVLKDIEKLNAIDSPKRKKKGKKQFKNRLFL